MYSSNPIEWCKIFENRRMLIFRQIFTFFADQSTPQKCGFLGTIPPLRDFQWFLCSDPVTILEWRHSRQSRRPSVDRFGLYVRLSGPAAKNHDLGKNGGFWGKWPPNIGLGKISIYPHTNTHGNTSFDVSNMVIGLLLLVDVGFEGEKKRRKPRKSM